MPVINTGQADAVREILYATTNDYKVQAANTALKGHDITLKKMASEVPDIAEIQDDSQEIVALDKARKYFTLLKQPLVVMDFGLFIEGLNGFPGVYTKYTIDTIGAAGLIKLVSGLDDRTAYTMRTIVYIDDSVTKAFTFRCPGSILLDERGQHGRNYDFIFCVDETGKTLAEMTEDEKAAVSGGAWRELSAWLQGRE